MEMKVRRIMESDEPITDSAPLIYSERRDGVDPWTDVRTDRFDLALDHTNAVTQKQLLKRQELLKPKEEPPTPPVEPVTPAK